MVATANLERKNKRSGVMILYFGSNRIVSNVSLFVVEIDKNNSEDGIAESLQRRVAGSSPYMYYEFKEGFDCSNAQGYLRKKGLARLPALIRKITFNSKQITMLKLFINFLLLTIVITGESQQVQVANLDRLKYKTGVMILYYGPNRVVKYCSLWDVKFKKEDNEDRIADLLKSRVAASDPYMYFEFKEGFDCNNATGYLQKKGVSKMGISSCTYINFTENTNGAVVQPGNGASDYNSDKGNDSVIIELPTYSWKLVDNILKKRQPALEKDGWRRVYTEYNLAGGNKNLWVGKALSFSPDSMYKVIATVVNSNYYLKLLNIDKPLVDGYPYQEFLKNTPETVLVNQ